MPEGEEPEVGIGAVGDPFEHRRHELATDLGRSRLPRREGFDVLHRCPRVVEAERPHPARRGIGAEQRFRRDLRDHVQHRREEDPLPKFEHIATAPLPRPLHSVAGQPHGAGHLSERGLFRRDEVGAAEVPELGAMLEHPLEAVVLGHAGSVRSPDVAVHDELVERGQGATGSDPVVGTCVDELEELDRELGVPQPACGELDVTLDLRSRNE